LKLIGESLQHYKIVRKLGQGGMGEVYLAEDTKLNRQVALKVLTAEVADNPEYRSRFKREAQAIAALNHPNIVTIHAVEEVEGKLFLVMELVKGQPLTAAIPRDGLSLPRLLDIAIPLADAVSAAHRVGILHRDLKPENVMIDEDGGIKVLDFGLAKQADEDVSDQQATVAFPDQQLTGEGRILGTVAYMSPEQAEGRSVDVRSDVFSLGTMLYEMSTGQRPFGGDTPVSTVTSIMRDDPVPVSSLNATLPRELSRVTKRCLAKNPDRRYESATGLRNDLLDLRDELASGELTAPILPTRSRGRSPLSWIALGILVASVGWAIVHFTGGDAGDPEELAQFSNMQASRLTRTGSTGAATISPDGRYVAHVEEAVGMQSLWVTQISTQSSVEVVSGSSEPLSAPTYSPDGDFLYYAAGDGLKAHIYRKPSVGGAARRLPFEALVGFSDLCLSPDGDRIAYTADDEGTTYSANTLRVRDIDGQESVTLLAPSEESGIIFLGSVSWSPDGRNIATVGIVSDEDGLEPRILIVPAEGGPHQVLNPSWNGFYDLCWTPDGSGILVSGILEDSGEDSRQILRVSYPDGAVQQITRDTNPYSALSITADGSTICATQGTSIAHLWLVDMENSGAATQLTSGSREDGQDGVTWLDDETILYSGDVSGSSELWTLDIRDRSVRRLTENDFFEFSPVAIDSQNYLFVSNRAGPINVWKGSLDGRPPVQLTFGSIDLAPTLAPEADWFVYMTTFDQEPTRFWKASLGGGDARPLPFENLGGYGVVSPDGRWLAYTVVGDDQFELRVAPVDGGEPVFRFDWTDRDWRRWSPDGKEISYMVGENGVENIWSQPLDGTAPYRVTNFDSGTIGTNWAPSPDGKRMVVSRGSESTDVVLLRAK
jgi:serine/threonine protein kinase